MQPSDQDSFRHLVDRAIAGDAGARDAIFDRVARSDGEGPLLMIARKVLPRGDRVRDIVESHDLVQTALRSGWLHLEQFQGETFEQFVAWLRAILRHKLLRLARHRPHLAGGTATPDSSTDRGLDQHVDHAAVAPLDEIARDESRDRLRRAIAKLSEPHRLVLELRLRGMRPADIAEHLGVRADAVRQRESRAVRQLREHLDHESQSM